MQERRLSGLLQRHGAKPAPGDASLLHHIRGVRDGVQLPPGPEQMRKRRHGQLQQVSAEGDARLARRTSSRWATKQTRYRVSGKMRVLMTETCCSFVQSVYKELVLL